MNPNQFGSLFRVSTFGESHGPALGALIDGCPAGVHWDQTLMNRFLERRRPGGELTSSRQETDQVEILSGVYQDKTLGTPIAAIVRNQDARSGDYVPEQMEQRRGHATDLWQMKFGHSDPRGSGRASGRETLSRVIGGSVARMLVRQVHPDIRIFAFVNGIGELNLSAEQCRSAARTLQEDPWDVDRFALRCPDEILHQQMAALIKSAKEAGESYGGQAWLRIENVPKGWGQPVFRKLKADLAFAYMGVGATMGVQLGEGFNVTRSAGNEFHHEDQNYGGIRGGISSGEPIEFVVGFKPTSTRQDLAKKGRHDPCIVPRAVPVLEAMTWLVLADHLLARRLDSVN